MSDVQQFEFKFRLVILYTIAIAAFLYAIVMSSGPAAILGIIAAVCAMEVRAERKEACKHGSLQTSKRAVSRAHAIVDILSDVQAGRITKEEAAEQIEKLTEKMK